MLLITIKTFAPFNRKVLSSPFKPLYSTLPLDPKPINPSTRQQLKSLVLSQYSHGKFSNLIQNVVALPSVLLSAAENLVPGLNHSLYLSVSKHFSVEEMGRQILDQRLDVESHCVKISSKGQLLVLPNLKLKVFIEAIRLVLEIVYDDRFVTFCYGGRVNMGRHTAIRYLKNSVKDPCWWFNVCFNRFKFETRNVDKLCLFMEEKIKDRVLIDIIKRLFECGVLRIELGGFYLGKGLLQEYGLCSILINIYFNGFNSLSF